jgi:hypothetical protein
MTVMVELVLMVIMVIMVKTAMMSKTCKGSHHTRDRQKICKKMAEKAVIVEMAMMEELSMLVRWL